jgi:hypothetical protein
MKATLDHASSAIAGMTAGDGSAPRFRIVAGGNIQISAEPGKFLRIILDGCEDGTKAEN